jgi:hypothetical protein
MSLLKRIENIEAQITPEIEYSVTVTDEGAVWTPHEPPRGAFRMGDTEIRVFLIDDDLPG